MPANLKGFLLILGAAALSPFFGLVAHCLGYSFYGNILNMWWGSVVAVIAFFFGYMLKGLEIGTQDDQ